MKIQSSHSLSIFSSLIIFILIITSINSYAQWQQVGAQLVGTVSGTAVVEQGRSVAISADGKVAAVGGYLPESGKVTAWVFTFNGVDFVQAGPNLMPSDNVGQTSWANVKVSISDDGSTVALSNTGDNGYHGAAWVFTFNGAGYIQVGSKLVGTGSIGAAYQGASLAISGDGKTIISGSRADVDAIGDNYGAVWIFAYNGTAFAQVGNKMVGAGAKGQGYSVSLSRDGSLAMVGGNGAWMYRYNGALYQPLGGLLPGSQRTSKFEDGWVVMLSKDGETAIAAGAQYTMTGQAMVLFYKNNTSSYSNTGESRISVARSTYSFSNDFKTAILGYQSEGLSNGNASKHILKDPDYVMSGGYFSTVGNAAGCQGNSVDISEDGKIAIIGGVCDRNGNGGAWVYSLCNVPDPIITAFCDTTRTYALEVHEKLESLSTFQWYLNDTLIVGATNTGLNTFSKKLNREDDYYCNVTNTCNTARSPKLATAYLDSVYLRPVSGNKIVCSGDTLHLTISDASKALWSNRDTSVTPSFAATQNQHLTFTGESSEGCFISGFVDIQVKDLPVLSIDLGPINYTCDTLQVLTLTGGLPKNNGAYLYGGTTVTNLNISTAGDYPVYYKVYGKNQCINTVLGILTVNHCTFTGICERPNPPCDCPGRRCPQKFHIYTGFTPNDDGVNDTWVMDTLPEINNIVIVDKWGTEVFKAEPYLNNWDGKQNGKKLPRGVYYYMLEIPQIKKRYSGSVSIMY